MIFDSIKNIETYMGLSPAIDRALRYLATHDLSELDEQQIDIQGDDVYVMIQHYDTEGSEGRSFESHDRYIDIQYVISGTETISYGNRTSLSVETAYDDKNDCTLYSYDANAGSIELNMVGGDFAVFFPADGHVPKLKTGNAIDNVKKAVFKVRVG